jgi:hypothetical protein
VKSSRGVRRTSFTLSGGAEPARVGLDNIEVHDEEHGL